MMEIGERMHGSRGWTIDAGFWTLGYGDQEGFLH
jgi:hypothetical protein